MVRLAIAAAATLVATQAVASDWSQAGGSIFPGQKLQAPPAQQVASGPVLARATEPLAQQPFADLIAKTAVEHGLDPKLLHALVLVESAYRPAATSPAGAVGLTQLMPATAAELGVVDRLDPEQNLAGGAAYLSAQLRRFQDVRLALAAYNAGPARVVAAGGAPKIKETQDHVARVIDCFLALAAGRAITSPSACRASEPLE